MSGKGFKGGRLPTHVQQDQRRSRIKTRDKRQPRRDQPPTPGAPAMRSSTTFYDAAVSGADPVNERPEFAHMLGGAVGQRRRARSLSKALTASPVT